MINVRRAGAHLASLGAVACGLTLAHRTRRRRRGDHRVFVLTYHDVSPAGENSDWGISQKRFRRHIRFLKQRYRLTTLAQAATCLRSEPRLAEDIVVLTLDDGFAGNYEAAWPVLREEGVPATIFLTTGFIDGAGLWFDLALRGLRGALASASELSEELAQALEKALGSWPFADSPEQGLERLKRLDPAEREALIELLRASQLTQEPGSRPLSWDQVSEMQAHGIEIGGHTVTHPILPLLPAELQEREIRECRDRIEQRTGERPTSFAYPNGDYDETALEIVGRLGFTAACTTRRGSNRPGCDPFTLRRIGVGRDPNWVLASRLTGLFDNELPWLLPARPSPVRAAPRR